MKLKNFKVQRNSKYWRSDREGFLIRLGQHLHFEMRYYPDHLHPISAPIFSSLPLSISYTFPFISILPLFISISYPTLALYLFTFIEYSSIPVSICIYVVILPISTSLHICIISLPHPCPSHPCFHPFPITYFLVTFLGTTPMPISTILQAAVSVCTLGLTFKTYYTCFHTSTSTVPSMGCECTL